MRNLTLTTLIILNFTVSTTGQTFLDQIRVGQKMPKKINIGGYTEDKSDDCSCRTFFIDYGVQSWETGGGGAELGEVYSIHYDENDTVVGIIKIIMRMNNEDAQKVYNSRLSEYMRNQSYFKDRQLIKVRDSDNGVVDGIYYFIYSYDGGKKYRSTGVVGKTIIEETYTPNSSYKPRLIN
jgi:hypothetical protein